MTTLTFRAPDAVSRRIRAAAKRRGVPVSRFIKEAAEREAARERTTVDHEPNEATVAALREPVDALTKYRTVAEALAGLKSDGKCRPKKSHIASIRSRQRFTRCANRNTTPFSFSGA
ncbi:MAG: hypothetical protein EXS39_03995 [Opitutaceae bacterium]|nr:hypothetical protein [Opitutaceae bacterium]